MFVYTVSVLIWIHLHGGKRKKSVDPDQLDLHSFSKEGKKV